MNANTRPEPKYQVSAVREGWFAPGYRDPELHLMTEQGELHVRLTPAAFVELHNILCAQQACIDNNGQEPIDMDRFRQNTAYIAHRRPIRPIKVT